MTNKETNVEQSQTQSTPDFTNFLVGFHKDIEEAKSSTKPINFFFGENGQAYELRNNQVGQFIIKTDKIPNIPKVAEGFKLNVPKIPFHLLLETVSFFKDVADIFNNDEAMVQYWYDTEKEEYFAVCLEQTTTKTNVRFKRNKELELDPKKILVMDIHSHNTMDAFFSGTDDSSEKETRVYGVVGKINQEKPNLKFRYSVAGKFKEVKMFELFETPTMKLDYGNGLEQIIQISETSIFYPKVDYPAEWKEVIEEGKKNRAQFFPAKTYGSAYGSVYGSGINGSPSITGREGKQMGFFFKDEEEPKSSRPSPFVRDEVFVRTNKSNAHKIDHMLDDSDFGEGYVELDEQEELQIVEEAMNLIGDLKMSGMVLLVDQMIEYGYDEQIIQVLQGRGYSIR